MRVLVNTSPLIALNRIERINLLRDLYKQVVCPQSVVDEIEAGVRKGHAPAMALPPWLSVEPDPAEKAFRSELGAGESAVLSLALLTKADLVILDDLQARLVAAELRLRITGTLGILVAAQHQGLIVDARGEARRLQAAGFRIHPALLETLPAGR